MLHFQGVAIKRTDTRKRNTFFCLTELVMGCLTPLVRFVRSRMVSEMSRTTQQLFLKIIDDLVFMSYKWKGEIEVIPTRSM